MNINSVSMAKINGKNLSHKNINKSQNSSNASISNNYKLAGYNVSFGALIKECPKNPGVLLNRIERKDIEDAATSAMAYTGDPDGHDKEILKDIFDKYGDNTSAIQLLAHCALRQNTNDPSTNKQNAMYINSILDTINTHFADDDEKRKESLDAMLSLKNADGNTMMHAYTKTYEMGSAGLLPHLLESLSDFPDLQIKALEQKNKIGKTVGQVVGYHNSADGIAINDTLYTLCARSLNPDRKTSIDLLRKNARVLNEGNKEVLEALQSDECICEGEDSSKQSTENNEKSEKSDKIIELKIHHDNSTKPSADTQENLRAAANYDNDPSIDFGKFMYGMDG